jgi:hypothetical protein
MVFGSRTVVDLITTANCRNTDQSWHEFVLQESHSGTALTGVPNLWDMPCSNSSVWRKASNNNVTVKAEPILLSAESMSSLHKTEYAFSVSPFYSLEGKLKPRFLPGDFGKPCAQTLSYFPFFWEDACVLFFVVCQYPPEPREPP